MKKRVVVRRRRPVRRKRVIPRSVIPYSKGAGILYRDKIKCIQSLVFNVSDNSLPNVYAFLFHYPAYMVLGSSTVKTMDGLPTKWTNGSGGLNSVFDAYRVTKMVIKLRTYAGGSTLASLGTPTNPLGSDIIISHDADSYAVPNTNTNDLLLNDPTAKSRPLTGGGNQVSFHTMGLHQSSCPKDTFFDTDNNLPVLQTSTTPAALNGFPTNFNVWASQIILIPPANNFTGSEAAQAVASAEVTWWVEFKGLNVFR